MGARPSLERRSALAHHAPSGRFVTFEYAPALQRHEPGRFTRPREWTEHQMSEIDFDTRTDWITDLDTVEGDFEDEPTELLLADFEAQPRAERRGRGRIEWPWAVIGTYAQVVVVAALFCALNWWPYPSSCGAGLAAFMGAECMIVAGAMWCTESAWRNRVASCHVVALMILLAGLTLVASQVLTRVGVVSIAGFHATQWVCG
jgi:hypothetical protein